MKYTQIQVLTSVTVYRSQYNWTNDYPKMIISTASVSTCYLALEYIKELMVLQKSLSGCICKVGGSHHSGNTWQVLQDTWWKDLNIKN